MSLEQEYQLEFFAKNDFQRKQCPSCEMYFWTQDPERERCGDPPCVEYSFLGNPATSREYTLSEMREAFLGFMEEKNHTRVNRYPVVARWRDDIYLTIASIADFQPHVTGGQVPPPANPLTISQPCIRLNDVDEVGKTGRHLTTFEMMAHHVFNYPDEYIYFKDRTVELCHEFLTDRLGMVSEEVSYKENPWAGGGNAGPAIEVLVRGLEVATLVFMKWEEDPDGDIEIKGDTYSEMDLQIVDTGYGLERLTWITNGRPTIYEAVFPDVVRFLIEEAGLAEKLKDPKYEDMLRETASLSSIMSVDTGAKVIELRRRVHERLAEKGIDIGFEEMLEVWEPLEKIYALADHSRCVAFMLGDGIVPSNVKAGYLTRMVLRKCLRLRDELGLEPTVIDLVGRQLDILKADFPDLHAGRDHIAKVLELETERYRETLEKGRRLVEREAKAFKGEDLPLEKLVDFYDTHGLNPEIVKSVAEPLGVRVDIPDDFYTSIANKHSKGEKGEAAYDTVRKDKKYEKLPPTKLLYYQDGNRRDFEAVVLAAKNGEVVLDQTCFYPEGGGQPADGGVLVTEDAILEVTDVQKYVGASGPVIVHKVDGGKVRVGDVVRGRVDWGKRLAHTRHHTATHILLGTARRVLGPHTWQAGAQKGYERSRIDIAHYARVTEEELRQMEQLANTVVLEDLAVEKTWLPREEAERKFGMQLYQGGVPEGREVRVVRIPEFDVECCGGTHVRSTTEVGPIKLLRSERVQDGVERIEFSAGLAAVRATQKRDDLLKETAGTFSVPLEEVPKAAKRFFDEWKDLRKKVEDLQQENADLQVQIMDAKGPDLLEAGGAKILVQANPNANGGELRGLAAQAIEKYPDSVAVYLGQGGQFVVISGPDSGANARDVAGVLQEAFEGRGGGKPDMVQGKLARDVDADEAKKALADGL